MRYGRKDGTRKAKSGRAMPALMLAAALCGCTSYVSITSEPSGATVFIDGVEHGVTPLEIMVTHYPTRRNRIVLEHPDCEPLKTTLRRRLSSRFRGDGEYQDVARGFGIYFLTCYTFGAGLTFLAVPVEEQHFLLAPKRESPTSGASPNDSTPRYGLAGWAEELRVWGGGR